MASSTSGTRIHDRGSKVSILIVELNIFGTDAICHASFQSSGGPCHLYHLQPRRHPIRLCRVLRLAQGAFWNDTQRTEQAHAAQMRAGRSEEAAAQKIMKLRDNFCHLLHDTLTSRERERAEPFGTICMQRRTTGRNV
jgi:hypothetical protein